MHGVLDHLHSTLSRVCGRVVFLVVPLRICSFSQLDVFGEGDYTVTMGSVVTRPDTKRGGSQK